jgi:hypothetical protein
VDQHEQNLSQVKNHELFPFSGFLTDPLQYMYLELYWLSLFKVIVGGNADASWRAWLPPDPERKGNPIFSAINEKLGRGVRVIHNQREPSEAHFAASGRYYPFQPFVARTPADPRAPEVFVDELCFMADPSEEAERLARRFLHGFCVQVTAVDDLEEMIRRYEDEVAMPAALEDDN